MEKCCQDKKNRFIIERKSNEKADVKVEKCKVCGRKHYTVDADPTRLTCVVT